MTVWMSVTTGCSQGRFLSSLLWSLVMVKLLLHLIGAGYLSTGFAGDIAILIRGKFPSASQKCSKQHSM